MKKIIVPAGILVAVVMGIFGYKTLVYTKDGEPQSSQTSIPLHQKQEQPANSLALPSDPGEAGKATLKGIDSDGDGVRDDIQRYIAETYPNSEKTRAALTQYVKGAQALLLDANDKQASINHAQEQQRAIECLYLIRPDDAKDIHSELRARMLNTEARTVAHIRADGQLGGQTFFLSEDPKSSCDFDPDKIKN